MECHILQTTSAGDAMYASMTPIDTPVAIAALVDGTMVEVDNPLRIDALYPTAQATCARARAQPDLSSSSSSPQDPVNPGCDPCTQAAPLRISNLISSLISRRSAPSSTSRCCRRQ